MLLKVAKPATAGCVNVPASVPAGPDASASVIEFVAVVTTLSSESTTDTLIDGLTAAFSPVGPGCTVKASFFAAANVPVAEKVVLTPPADAMSVFVPAVIPSCQLVAVARPVPAALVCDPPVTVPPPEATVKVTATPGTIVLPESSTVTRGAV